MVFQTHQHRIQGYVYISYKIKNTLEEILGSFGLPVIVDDISVLDDKGDANRRGEAERFLSRCFGKYFIDLGKRSVTEVTQKEYSDFAFRGFSCWDLERKIFIRYRWQDEAKKDTPFRVYFNEIRVDDDRLYKMVNIAYFDSEVYLFSERAENFLEINRDDFLYEKRRYIADAICGTHLACLRFLLETTPVAEENDLKNIIWTMDDNLKYHENVKRYLSFLVNKGELVISDIGTGVFIQNNTVIQLLRSEEIDRLSVDDHRDIWLTDTRYKYIENIKLLADDSRSRCIVEDVFYNYMDLAITELECILEQYGGHILIYRTAVRSGMPMSVPTESFDEFIRMRYDELMVDSRKSQRMMLPGIEPYQELCVSKLTGNLGTPFEKRLNSSIILPLTVGQIKELLTKEKISEELDKLLDENEPSYSKILEYISYYRLNKNLEFKKSEIKKAYIELLVYICRVLK